VRRSIHSRPMSQPQLLIVVTSTRPTRIGPALGDWFTALARKQGGFDVETVDLAELNLPLLDEPEHPRFGRYQHDHTKRWSAIVDAADAIVFVTPEYNHSFPASLKNAYDYLSNEWKYKPLGFVSYGGIAAGTRAVQAFKPVAAALLMMVPANIVNVAWVGQKVKDGKFLNDADVDAAGNAMLAEMLQLHGALHVLRK
jgi:NAD(P)H-dependent FMN reductase